VSFGDIRRQPFHGQWMVSPVKDEAWLEWMSRLMGKSAATEAAELPRSRFHCRLDDQPDHLVPQRQLEGWTRPEDIKAPLLLNPQCRFTRNGDLPGEQVSAGLLDNFALQGDMVWITDRDTTAVRPFWLGRELAAVLAELKAGDPAPLDLPEETKRLLTMADVLVPADHALRRHTEWAEAIACWATSFRQKGYTPIGRLIHPFHLASLRRYYRHLIRTGNMRLGDDQSELRYAAYNESVARFFHQQLAATVSAIAGEPVKPSYVYLASYQGGARLEKHTDREQCEFSITFCLDYSPEPKLHSPWPLYLHTQSGTTQVFQGIGDGLLYRGRELPHSRETLPQGHTSTSFFFHYVQEAFAGPLG
jgi:hypothetical protein